MATDSITATNLQYYKKGVSWAGDFFTVIPGSDRKAPFVKFKKFVHPDKTPTTEIDRIRFRSFGFDQSVTPLLLLDSPTSDAMDLCVIDVDDLSVKRDVIQWIKDKGYGEPLVVTTGREGGGEHYYFRRANSPTINYRSQNAVKLFDGKVDTKASGAFVVAPGARHRSGRIYEATFKGKVVERLADVFRHLPEMRIEDWRELQSKTGKPGDKPELDVEYLEQDDPAWDKLLAEGPGRYQCPWCGAGRSRGALTFNGRVAYCFKEEKARRPKIAKHHTEEASQEIDDWEQIKAELDKEEAALKQDALEKYQESLAKIAPPQMLDDDILYMGILDEIDPLDKLRVEVGAAVEVARQSDIRWFNEGCPRAPYMARAERGAAQTGIRSRYTQRRMSCWRYNCPNCGEFKIHGLQAAIRGWVHGLQSKSESTWTVGSFSVDYDTFLKQDRHKLKRLAKKWGDEFHWIGIRVKPGEMRVIMLWQERAKPKLPHTLEEDTIDQIVYDTFQSLDLIAWDEFDGRTRIVYGPSAMQAAVKALQDFLTGENRAGKPRANLTDCKPSERPRNAAVAVTYDPFPIKKEIERQLTPKIVLGLYDGEVEGKLLDGVDAVDIMNYLVETDQVKVVRRVAESSTIDLEDL
jgi:hypothetical protein